MLPASVGFYSPKCVELEFSEVGLPRRGILGSSAKNEFSEVLGTTLTYEGPGSLHQRTPARDR
jgi:hypothetical protein